VNARGAALLCLRTQRASQISYVSRVSRALRHGCATTPGDEPLERGRYGAQEATIGAKILAEYLSD